MKKLLIAGNILLLGIIFFQACNPTVEKDKPGVKTVSKDCGDDSCNREICKDYSGIPLDGVIDGPTLRKLSIDYAADPGKANITGEFMADGRTPEKDALSVYFRLEQLKNFIWRMEQAACRSGCDTSTDLAIRFYLIRYPGDLGTAAAAECLSTLSKDCANKHSLALVPAFKKGEYYYDYSLTNFSFDCFSLPITNNNLATLKSAAMVSSPGFGDNHGGLGPPPAPGTYPTSE